MSAEQPMDAPPSKEGRSLTGFYIALGVVAALVGLGAWLWTPARIWYWEREVRWADPCPITSNGSIGGAVYGGPAADAARKLVALGPRARQAVSRLLLSSEKGPIVLRAGRDSPARWVLPILANACRKEPDRRMRIELVIAAEQVSEVNFDAWRMEENPGSEEACHRFLDWWDREGRARYGGSGE